MIDDAKESIVADRSNGRTRRVDPLSRGLRPLIALACGGLLCLSCADFDIWPLAWIGWVPVLWICLDERTGRPFRYGFLCGLAGLGGGFYWVVPYLQRFANLPLVLALPIFLALIAVQALSWGAFCWLLRRLRDGSGLGVTFLAPALFVAIELLTPSVFVWYFAITQAWVTPVIQIAELTGPLGVSFLLVMTNTALYEALHARWRGAAVPARTIGAAALLLLAVVFGFVRIAEVEGARRAAPKLRVGIVQSNTGIRKDSRTGRGERLAALQAASARLELEGAELVLWPESAFPYVLPRDLPVSSGQSVRTGFRAPLLFGALTKNPSGYPFNSALLLDAEGKVLGVYDKTILIVFGEYVPYYEQLGFLRRAIPAVRQFSRGKGPSVLALPTRHGPVRLGPMICYEDIFPSFGRRLAKARPNLLVNLTNDAWFGDSSEPWEHLALSVYRAVELRLDLVRAVNTGVSALVDSTGRVVARTGVVDPRKTPQAGVRTLLVEAAIQAPQTLYATLGEWFGASCLAASALVFLRARRREGAPVRWRLVATGAALLLASIVTVVALTGPGHLGLALSLLARTLPAGSVPDELALAVGWRLFLGLLAGCVALGALLARRAPLERALAVLAVWVAPAAILGNLEGQQAELVVGGLAGVLAASVAARLARIQEPSDP